MMPGMKGRGMVSQSVDKAKDTKYVLKRLAKYLEHFKGRIAIAISLAIASNVFALIGPLLTGLAIGAMEDGVDFDKVYLYVGLMLGFYALSAILSYLLALLMVHISQNVVKRMRKDLFDVLESLPVKYYDTHQTGDIISRMSYDIDTINTSLSTDVISVLASIITVVFSFIMMLILSPLLILVFVVTIPISIVFTRIMSRITKKMFRKRSMKLGELNGFVEEMISGQKTIKSYVQEDSVLEKFDIKNEEAAEASYEAEYYSSTVGPSVNFINNFSISLIGAFGAVLYFYQSIKLGAISSFLLYSRRFSGPINEAANIIADLQSALAAAERVFQTMDEYPEPKDTHDARVYEDVVGHVVFEDVTFGYLKDQIIIDHLSFEANPGQLIAIVGPTGAGKTTLINLLMRFYDIQSGVIKADDVSITDYTRKSLRKAYAMVLQDTWLFHGSVLDNIRYGNPSKTLEEVMEVAKKANIHGFIEKLPEGYYTILKEDGFSISKGQKQLMTIARAMLFDAKMLILDEATSNVDTRTEIKIQKAMRELMKGKTAFVIAHRLSTIQNADLILVVQQGNIVEQGNHQELMQKQGQYYQMYVSQFD